MEKFKLDKRKVRAALAGAGLNYRTLALKLMGSDPDAPWQQRVSNWANGSSAITKDNLELIVKAFASENAVIDPMSLVESHWPETRTGPKPVRARPMNQVELDAANAGDVLNKPVSELGLNARVSKHLEEAGITLVGHLIQRDAAALLALPHFGALTLSNVVTALASRRLSLNTRLLNWVVPPAAPAPAPAIPEAQVEVTEAAPPSGEAKPCGNCYGCKSNMGCLDPKST